MEPNKKCSKCGSAFACKQTGNCWCDEVNLSLETLVLLKKEYGNCLCPDCLKSFESLSQGT